MVQRADRPAWPQCAASTCTGPCRPRVACSAEPRKALPACTAKTCCVACRPPVWLACRCVIGPSRGLKRSRENLLGTGLRARPSRQGEKRTTNRRRHKSMQRVRFCYMPLGLFGTEVHAEVRPPWVALSKGLRLPLLRKHGRLRHKHLLLINNSCTS